MQASPFADLLLPTPLGTLIASLVVFGGLMAVVVLSGLAVRLAPRRERPGLGTRLLLALRAVDRRMVRGGSLVIGTAMQHSWQRVPRLLLTFALLTAGGVALPFPAAMVSLTLGLLAILLVFRHWSRDETERAAVPPGSTQPPRMTVPIEGDLTIEMALACGYLLFVVPLAFARLHAADMGFELTKGAGPFAFVFYMIIELLKLGTVVDYYDLFADQIAFGPLAQAQHPSAVAKYVTLGFRGVFDLIILTALKRMFEIAGRISAGQDLRDVRAPLESPNEDDDPPAIARLGRLTRDGNLNARLLLEQVARGELILNEERTKLFSSELRLAAAATLREAGQFGPAVAALEALENESAESDPDLHARAAEQLQLARREFRRQALEPQGAQSRTFLDDALAQGRLYEARVTEQLSEAVFNTVFPTLVAAIGQHDQMVSAIFGEAACAPAGLHAALVGGDPDLEQTRGRILKVHF